ncbi:MAG: hypothetical protein PVI57_00540 [Gemmatimonadota bacterium]
MSRAGVFTVLLSILLLSPGVLSGQGTRLDDIEPYLMDHLREVDLARSAAPFDLGEDATVWVLAPSGYEVASEGTNGFACFVGRGWSGPILVGSGENRRLHPDVFDPELLAPHCFNPRAARSLVPWHRERTRLLIEGVAAEEVDERVDRKVGTEIPLPEPGAMAYMMSPNQDLGPRISAWRPHVMVYVPRLENADWGIPGFTHDYPFVAEEGSPWSVVVVPMRRFSDGTVAPETPVARGHR